MSTYFKLHYHLVFSTKNRVACLDKDWRPLLWEYMGGTIRGLGGVPHGVGGWVDHIHVLFDLRPTHAIPDVVRELKKASDGSHPSSHTDFERLPMAGRLWHLFGGLAGT